MIRASCRAVIRLAAVLAPRRVRARWREEWLGEIDASRARGSWPAVRLALGAPLDALSSRWTTRARLDGSGWRGPLHTDIRQTARMLWRSPGHVAAVTACLAIGIAANIAVFSLMNAVLFRDLPGVHERERIVRLALSYRGSNGQPLSQPFSRGEYSLIHDGSGGVTGIAAEGITPTAIASPDIEAVTGLAAYVSGNYFQVFGTQPVLGRLLQPADDHASADPAVVLSHRFWTRHFDQRPDAIGRLLAIGGRPHVIVGIAPEGFAGMQWEDLDSHIEAFVTLSSPARRPDDTTQLTVFARLSPGETTASAAPKVGVLGDRIAAAYPDDRPGARLVVRQGLGPSASKTDFWLTLLAALGGPLLILISGCANAANLQLARATMRLKELTVRSSLGASRLQILRLLTLEAVALAALATGLGLAGGVVALRVAAQFFRYRTPIDATVLAFTVGVGVLVVIGFGVAPGWLITGRDNLRREKRTSRARNGLVIAQVSLSLLLLLVTALSVRTLQKLDAQVPEAADRIAATGLRFDTAGYDAGKAQRFMREFASRIESKPYVDAVGITDSQARYLRRTQYWLPGDAETVRRFAAGGKVSAGYFAAMAMPLRRGRIFEPSETLTAAVVDELFVEQHALPDPVVGAVLRVPDKAGTTRPVTIVGVVGNAMVIPGWDRQEKGLYLPLGDGPVRQGTLVARTSQPASVLKDMKAALAAIDPHLPPTDLATKGDLLRNDLEPGILLATVASIVGGIALALAVAGVYAVVRYVVSLRAREIGIRMAIGAKPVDIVLLFVKDGGRLVGIGIIAGLTIALPTTWLLRATLYGLSPIDPVSFAGCSLLLLAAGLLSSVIPARRAARIDPLIALRHD